MSSPAYADQLLTIVTATFGHVKENLYTAILRRVTAAGLFCFVPHQLQNLFALITIKALPDLQQFSSLCIKWDHQWDQGIRLVASSKRFR